ncbi:MAG TPA: PIN domain-containing protein [Hyphomicrobiales bacterium]|jgi:PIN domain nuclease of toxin-antitoxin system
MMHSVGAKIAPIKQKISFEAAALPQLMGNRDPGDCFIVATARVAKLAIVTRDSSIHEFASRHPAYVQLVDC